MVWLACHGDDGVAEALPRRLDLGSPKARRGEDGSKARPGRSRLPWWSRCRAEVHRRRWFAWSGARRGRRSGSVLGASEWPWRRHCRRRWRADGALPAGEDKVEDGAEKVDAVATAPRWCRLVRAEGRHGVDTPLASAATQVCPRGEAAARLWSSRRRDEEARRGRRGWPSRWRGFRVPWRCRDGEAEQGTGSTRLLPGMSA